MQGYTYAAKGSANILLIHRRVLAIAHCIAMTMPRKSIKLSQYIRNKVERSTWATSCFGFCQLIIGPMFCHRTSQLCILEFDWTTQTMIWTQAATQNI